MSVTEIIEPTIVEPGMPLAIVFDGPCLRDPVSRAVIAELDEDGVWRTAEGIRTEGLTLPIARVTAAVTPLAHSEWERGRDASWRSHALGVVRALAAEVDDFTTDEVWARLKRKPREGRQIGPIMLACEREGIIEPTPEHRPSRRGVNHGRPQQVWRSLVRARPSLFDPGADVGPDSPVAPA